MSVDLQIEIKMIFVEINVLLYMDIESTITALLNCVGLDHIPLIIMVISDLLWLNPPQLDC